MFTSLVNKEKHEQWQFNDFENLFCLSVNIAREGEGKLANWVS